MTDLIASDSNTARYEALAAQHAGMDTDALYQESLQAAKDVFRAGFLPYCPVSYGKDSGMVLNIMVAALRECVAEGIDVKPLHVATSIPSTENPEVAQHVRRQQAALLAYAEENGLSDLIKVHTAEPDLRAWFQVSTLAGVKLPSANSKNSDCTQDLKISPMSRIESSIMAEAANAGCESITVLGTRINESVARKHNMIERGDFGSVFESNTGKAISLICWWSADDVWMGLSQSAPQPDGFATIYPAFNSVDDVLELYRGATGECPITAQESAGEGKPCSSSGRFGCHSCLKADTRDIAAQAARPRTAYVQHLQTIRNYIAAIIDDPKHRRWVGRKPDAVTGYVTIYPNCFANDTLEQLFLMYATADVIEAERAAEFAKLVAEGRADEDAGVQDILSDDSMGADWNDAITVADVMAEGYPHKRRAINLKRYLETMVEPMFQVLDPRAVIAIDAIWSRDAMFTPFHGLYLWDQVWNKGVRVFAPTGVERVRFSAPKPRYLRVGWDSDEWTGLMTASHMAMVGEGCDSVKWAPAKDKVVTDLRYAGGELVEREEVQGRFAAELNLDLGPRFDVDPESAHMILTVFLQDRLAAHNEYDPKFLTRTTAYFWYLQFGALQLSAKGRLQADMLAHRGRLYEETGLVNPDVSKLRKRAVTAKKHAKIKARMERKMAFKAEQDARAVAAEQARYQQNPLAYDLDRLAGLWAERQQWVDGEVRALIRAESIIKHDQHITTSALVKDIAELAGDVAVRRIQKTIGRLYTGGKAGRVSAAAEIVKLIRDTLEVRKRVGRATSETALARAELWIEKVEAFADAGYQGALEGKPLMAMVAGHKNVIGQAERLTTVKGLASGRDFTTSTPLVSDLAGAEQVAVVLAGMRREFLEAQVSAYTALIELLDHAKQTGDVYSHPDYWGMGFGFGFRVYDVDAQLAEASAELRGLRNKLVALDAPKADTQMALF